MTAPILGDALGPKARRRVLVISTVSTALLAALVVLALRRLGAKGQLDAELWRAVFQVDVMRFLLGGLGNTARAAAAALVLAMSVGAAMALARLARTPLLRWPARAYVEFFRGFPLLLLILFSFLGLPKLGVDLPTIGYLILALALYNSAVLAEIFRAGILSLDRGQMEAAQAVGLRYWQAMRLVVVPQALRRMIPAIVSQVVTLLKDTSLGFLVGYEELLRRGQIAGEFGKNQLQSLVVVAGMYLVVNFTLSRVARHLEVRQRRRYSAGGISVAGVEDLAVVAAVGESASRR
jgi:glutamate transport system permease protein